MVISSNAVQPALGIQALNIPKRCVTSAYERMLNDTAAIDFVLKVMNIENRNLAKVVQMDLFDPKRVTQRTMFSHMERNLSKEMILKFTRNLTENKKSSFFNPELNVKDSEEQIDCLKESRVLTVEGTDRKLTRTQSFVVEIRVNNVWLTVVNMLSIRGHAKIQDLSNHLKILEPDNPP